MDSKIESTIYSTLCQLFPQKIVACQCLQDVVSLLDCWSHDCYMKIRYIETISIIGLRTRGSSESAILIFGLVLTFAGSGVNKVTDDFGVDINSEFSPKNRDFSVKLVLTFCSSSGIFTPEARTVMSSE